MPRRPLILCVDDEFNGLEGRKMLLEDAGYKVLVATTGADALQLFASHPVDLVLLDYHMPGMNGDVVAEHMKAGQSAKRARYGRKWQEERTSETGQRKVKEAERQA